MGERGRAEQQKDQNNPHHDRLPFSQKLRFPRGGTIFRILQLVDLTNIGA